VTISIVRAKSGRGNKLALTENTNNIAVEDAASGGGGRNARDQGGALSSVTLLLYMLTKTCREKNLQRNVYVTQTENPS